VKVQLSKHVLKDKLPLLKKWGFIVTKTQVGEVIKNPDHIDKDSDYPKIIVSKDFDEKHVLRVVYKVSGDIIKVITLYPAEKGRYY
jgi:hypothetical protein